MGIQEMLTNVLTQIRVSDVFTLLSVWMLSGTSRVMKCVPSHFVAEQLPHFVLSIILGFHALTGCNTLLPLSGNGKKTCWKMFIKYAHLLTGVVRDDNVDDAWAFVCSLYRI